MVDKDKTQASEISSLICALCTVPGAVVNGTLLVSMGSYACLTLRQSSFMIFNSVCLLFDLFGNRSPLGILKKFLKIIPSFFPFYLILDMITKKGRFCLPFDS